MERIKKEYRTRRIKKECNKKKQKERPHCEKRTNREREWEEVETLSGAQCADWRPACSFFMGQMSHCVTLCCVVCLQLSRWLHRTCTALISSLRDAGCVPLFEHACMSACVNSMCVRTCSMTTWMEAAVCAVWSWLLTCLRLMSCVCGEAGKLYCTN